MNLMLRIALQLLVAAILFFVCIQAIAIVALNIFWPGAEGSSGAAWFVAGLFAVLFLMTLLLIGWYLGRPVYFMIVWVRQLARGDYAVPARWEAIRSRRKGAWRGPYAVYRELFDHLASLSITLKRNHQEKLESEQAKQEWIRGISHDLKTPLTYISGYSAMLTNPDYRWSDLEHKRFISIIEQKAAHLQELVQDLNETIHMNIPVRAEETDLVELVRRTAADVGSAPWASGYSLNLESDSDQLPVSCDPKLLTRALRNLLVNAIVHNPEGTEITVHMKKCNEETTEIRVEDNGVGFNEATDDRDPASTGSGGRSGLGLSIARRLIEAHGGELFVSSEPNQGTTLTILLPIAPQPSTLALN